MREIDQLGKTRHSPGVYRPPASTVSPGRTPPSGFDQDLSLAVNAPVRVDQYAPGDPPVNFHFFAAPFP
jgi:hypothetical protein